MIAPCRMKDVRKALLVFILPLGITFGPFSIARSEGWFTAAISRIELTSTSEVIVFLDSPTNHECGTKRVDYVNPGDSASKSILAALLAWQAQDKAVSFHITGCAGTTALFSTVVND